MSVQSEVGEAVGRFCDTVSASAAADPSTVGTVALSLAGTVAAGLAWWRKRRNREGREARIPVTPGHDVEYRATSRSGK
jgi:hypothetical protein